jgi:AraC-like DNA-binding protein
MTGRNDARRAGKHARYALHVDVLQDRLLRARATGATFARSIVDPPWGLRLPADTQLAVHTMVRGDGFLWLDDAAAAVSLRPGDIALVRGGRVHHLAHAPGAACIGLTDFSRAAATLGQASASASIFLCGAYRFAGDVGENLVESLPPLLHLRPQPGDRLRVAAELLSLELADERAGQQTVLDRLLDVILVQSLRHHFDDPGTEAPPWYAGGAHPALKNPLQAMHDHPEHPWTVPELARLAGMSRSTFARLFHQVLAQTPMDYLGDLRMSLARDALRETTDTLAVIAQRCGYSSPFAFSAAFTRRHGESPGKWRTRSTEVEARAVATGGVAG